MAGEAARKQAKERQRERDRGRKANDKGRHFQQGMAQIRGETPANGWRQEQTIKTPLGDRRHDTARINEKGGRDFSEYKNQIHIRADALIQLAKDRHELNRDPNSTGRWIILEGARVDPMVARQLERMQREFGERFELIRISREQAQRAVAQGKAIERNVNQLELVDSEELRREQRKIERAERVREAAATQAAAAKALEAKQAREREQAQQERQRLLELRGQQLREQMPRAPAEVVKVLALSQPLPGEHTREAPSAADGATRAGHDARARQQQRGRGRTIT